MQSWISFCQNCFCYYSTPSILEVLSKFKRGQFMLFPELFMSTCRPTVEDFAVFHTQNERRSRHTPSCDLFLFSGIPGVFLFSVIFYFYLWILQLLVKTYVNVKFFSSFIKIPWIITLHCFKDVFSWLKKILLKYIMGKF